MARLHINLFYNHLSSTNNIFYKISKIIFKILHSTVLLMPLNPQFKYRSCNKLAKLYYRYIDHYHHYYQLLYSLENLLGIKPQEINFFNQDKRVDYIIERVQAIKILKDYAEVEQIEKLKFYMTSSQHNPHKEKIKKLFNN